MTIYLDRKLELLRAARYHSSDCPSRPQDCVRGRSSLARLRTRVSRDTGTVSTCHTISTISQETCQEDQAAVESILSRRERDFHLVPVVAVDSARAGPRLD